MIFRQLFEPVSSTYTYLIACEESGQTILVDPVLPTWQRDLETLKNLGLRLAVTLDTHIHADHITAASRLKLETGSSSISRYPETARAACVPMAFQSTSRNTAFGSRTAARVDPDSRSKPTPESAQTRGPAWRYVHHRTDRARSSN